MYATNLQINQLISVLHIIIHVIALGLSSKQQRVVGCNCHEHHQLLSSLIVIVIIKQCHCHYQPLTSSLSS